MATLRDVAREAGVSVSTASHALNNYNDIGVETKQKVIEAARRLNYHADSAAKALVSKKSGLMAIALFGSGLAHPFFHKVVQGAVTELEDSGRNAITTIVSGRYSDSTFVKKMHERRLEGILAMGLPDEDEAIHALMSCGIPVVFIDALVAGASSAHVHTDNFTGTKQAAKHLLDLGHRRIAYINERSPAVIFEHREQGYLAALNEYNIDDKSLIYIANTWEEGQRRAQEAARAGATAIMTFSDLQAMAVIEGLRLAGLSVPEDVSVVGFDDIELAAYASPPLTTVRQDGVLMGKLAVGELVKMAESSYTKSEYQMICHMVPGELVVRASTTPIQGNM